MCTQGLSPSVNVCTFSRCDVWAFPLHGLERVCWRKCLGWRSGWVTKSVAIHTLTSHLQLNGFLWRSLLRIVFQSHIKSKGSKQPALLWDQNQSDKLHYFSSCLTYYFNIQSVNSVQNHKLLEPEETKNITLPPSFRSWRNGKLPRGSHLQPHEEYNWKNKFPALHSSALSFRHLSLLLLITFWGYKAGDSNLCDKSLMARRGR